MSISLALPEVDGVNRQASGAAEEADSLLMSDVTCGAPLMSEYSTVSTAADADAGAKTPNPDASTKVRAASSALVRNVRARIAFPVRSARGRHAPTLVGGPLTSGGLFVTGSTETGGGTT